MERGATKGRWKEKARKEETEEREKEGKGETWIKRRKKGRGGKRVDSGRGEMDEREG